MADKKQFTNVDEYIKTFPASTQTILTKIRQTIRQVIPEASEVISYDIPTFKLHNRHVIYFSGWEKHISLYPRPTSDAALDKELAPYASGKGTIKFPLDKPIPYELVEKITVALVKDNLERTNR